MIDVKTLTRNWNYPTSVRFGPGRIGELPAVCKELGMKRPYWSLIRVCASCR